MQRFLNTFLLLLTTHACFGFAQDTEIYRIGPDDKLLFRAADIEELNEKHVLVARDGMIDLPLAGRFAAGGLSVAQLRDNVNEHLKQFYYDPRISVEVEEYASQPVSVVGAVAKSGIYQLRGRKSITEVLAMAGGVLPEAGYTVRVERSAGQKTESLSYNLREIMRGGSQAELILVEPHDVITIPRSQLIYVIGDVRKPGGFTLGEKENVSVLQALALAEGPVATAALNRSSILRIEPGRTERKTISVDIKRLMGGKQTDLGMQADDILVIPSSARRKVAIRSAEIAAQTVSGLVIWRGL